MKFLFLILFPLMAYAENFVSPRIVEAQLPQAYQLKADCENVEGEECVDLDIAKLPTKVYETFSMNADDTSKPIYEAASNVSPCQSADECASIVSQSNFCPSTHLGLFRFDENKKEAYCTRIIAYQQKELRKVRVSEAKKTLYDAEVLALAQKRAYQVADAAAQKAVDCGKATQRLLLIRNAQKNLTTAQIKQMVKQYADTINLLDTGSLVSAVEEINAVQPDGVLVTTADKAALIAHINGCK